MTFTEGQFDAAQHATYEEETKASTEVRRLAQINECIQQIRQGKRPFRRDYETESHHNGHSFMTHDTVWSAVKPIATQSMETYTLIDMPEYEEALRRLAAIPADTPPRPRLESEW